VQNAAAQLMEAHWHTLIDWLLYGTSAQKAISAKNNVRQDIINDC